MNDILISIVIPCYNEKKYINDCIQSIINQNFPSEKMEIIVVDGMSNDGTRDILFRLQTGHKNIFVLDNLQKKTPIARNIGVKASKGKFVAIWDAHAIYDKNYIIKRIDIFRMDPKILAVGCPYNSVGKSKFGKAAAKAMSHILGVGNAKHRFPNYKGFAEGAHFPIYKKEVFEKFGLFDENLIRNQDDEFNFRFTKNGFKSYIIPDENTKYYVRNSPSKLFIQYFQYGFWRVAVLKKHKIPISIRQLLPALFYLLISIIFILYFISVINSILIPLIFPFIYIFILIIFSILIIRKNDFVTGLLFPVAILIMHFSYAIGFLNGLFSNKTRI